MIRKKHTALEINGEIVKLSKKEIKTANEEIIINNIG
tara:strand:- start:413 stop:523 length:111 start_codon:yes stop_codon:yes gene_type:complete